MNTTVHTATVVGVESVPVGVEVSLVRRLPGFVTIGLSATASRETAERVRCAMQSCGFAFPRMRVVVNVTPVELRKRGVGCDLPIAVSILVADRRCTPIPDHIIVVGELSLEGNVRSTPAAIVAGLSNLDKIVVTDHESAETIHAYGGRAWGVTTLTDAVELLSEDDVSIEAYDKEFAPVPPPLSNRTRGLSDLDFAEVRGQDDAIRQLALAAKTKTPVLLVGNPGCGKTMLAARAVGLLPDLTVEEQRDTARISAAAGLLAGGVRPEDRPRRPFRAPHHSISMAGMLCSGAYRPGETVLAHGGVLMLDEVAEFSQHVMEMTLQAQDLGHVTAVRASGSAVLPTDFWLIASSNPCACGYLGHPTHKCRCTPEARERFDARLARAVPKDHVRIEMNMPSVVMLATSEPGKTTKQWRDGAEENDHG
jgi:magnesium chelatase family protein